MTPKCVLCSGTCVQERNVGFEREEACIAFAWVCTQCSAGYPIAYYDRGLGRRGPLWSAGKRYDDDRD